MTNQYKHLAFSALIAFGGLAAVLLASRFKIHQDLMMLVFFAGASGAIINNYYRLSKVSRIQKKIENELNTNTVTLHFYVSMFVSGVLGLVAYILFLSGMLQGELFPKFIGLDKDYVELSSLLMDVKPEHNMDSAKAITWAFIAGYGERWIPNVIDNMLKKPKQEVAE